MVGEFGFDGDERRMDIRIGNRTNRVTLGGWPVTNEQRDHVKRAGEVWSAIRRLVSYDGLTLP